ncbi:MAG: M48 family metalloprotease [Candidatus Babeliales bacterium]
MKYKKLLFLMWSVIGATEMPQTQKSVFAQEIIAFKQEDKDFKALSECSNDVIKELVLLNDLKKILEKQKFSSSSECKSAQSAISAAAELFARFNGSLLDAQKAPKLFAMIQQLASQCKVAMPHVIVGTSDRTASISLTKNFSIVFIGMAFIEQLSDDGIRAVIAHELGHIVHQHSAKLFLQDDIKRCIDGALCGPFLALLYIAFCKGNLNLLFTLAATSGISWLALRALFEFYKIDPALNEQEADDVALELVGPDASIEVMKKLKAKILNEQQAFENDVSFLKAKKTSLDESDIATIQAIRKNYARLLRGKNITPHPSIRARILHVQQWQAEHQKSNDLAQQFSEQAACQTKSDPAQQLVGRPA